MSDHSHARREPSVQNEPAAQDTACCGPEGCCEEIDRRGFVKAVGAGTAIAVGFSAESSSASAGREGAAVVDSELLEMPGDDAWPILKRYGQSHLARIAMPLGGLGTGTVSLGGRGDLRDWEIMNRPAKGYVPSRGEAGPFFALFAKAGDEEPVTRVLEGPLELSGYEGSHGSTIPNENLPRFRKCDFGSAYPLAQVHLSDTDVPVDVRLRAFNPLIPADAEASGIPMVVLRYSLFNKTGKPVKASVCGSMPNFIGADGWETKRDWKGDRYPVGAKKNVNIFRQGSNVHGVSMASLGVDSKASTRGSIALTMPATPSMLSTMGITFRTAWTKQQWGTSILDFWDDFSADGRLDRRESTGGDMPMASLAAEMKIPPRESREVTFLLTWHFPNRFNWSPKEGANRDEDRVGNYYTTQYPDAWGVAEEEAPRVAELEKNTVDFVRAFCESSLPEEAKEAALFNVSTLRSQTCFRTQDGRFYGWEGCCNQRGCCWGSCTHVWNYEQATALLFGQLAASMREVEFGQATDENGLMSFRVQLPIQRAQEFGKAAADGQMGCIMKMYRDWQLSGDDEMLKSLWPNVRRAVEFCWIEGGWDADRDGVMEGCQHNTMDVEYYGPNPQMGVWYLGALRAAEEMARYLGENEFAATCQSLFERGRAWIDENLFNGEYYEHHVRPPKDKSEIAPSLLVGMGTKDPANPDYQLGPGCLVDQLVGQFMAHVCGLGHLVTPENARKTLQSIMKYNNKESLHDHFNCMRTFALGDESALLMASYPKERPKNPFPYFTEVMTGFEYAAAVGMLYEGLVDEGLQCIRNIRGRYDGRKRSPFNEAECGHHYARAMASWAAVLALSGFHYSGVEKAMTFSPVEGKHFWSNGYAWGTCALKKSANAVEVDLSVLHGQLALARFKLTGFGEHRFDEERRIAAKERTVFSVSG